MAMNHSTSQRPVRALGCLSVAATLLAGSLCLPTAAHAAPAVAACLPGGVTAADDAVAQRVRPSMNGRRLGRAVTGRSIACARAIVSVVRDGGLGPRAAVIALTTAIAESTLHNHTVAHDHDSLGLFQQRPSQGWGRPGQLIDPVYATRAFLSAMFRKHPGGSWMTGDIGAICQRVQGSAHPGAYAPEAHDAQLIVAALWGRRLDAPAAPKPAPAAPKKPAGPFQQSLATLASELGPIEGEHDVTVTDYNNDRRLDLVIVRGRTTRSEATSVRIMDGLSDLKALALDTATPLRATDARHAYAMSDWNADGRPDLVVIQKSGTASGRTEVRVLDGASFFQHLVVEVATAIEVTDDRHQLSVTDVNGDARPDLVVVQKSGTASGKTEVQVLDGASNLQQRLSQTVTALPATDQRHDLSVSDWNGDRRPDLVMVQKSGAASGKIEIRVLDGASGFRRGLLQAKTGHVAIDDRYDVVVTDWNSDARPDLLVVQKSGTASGRAEAVVLAG